MKTGRNFSCFIIGKSTLLTQCAQTIIDKGHSIAGIISSDDQVRSWAKGKAIRCIDLSSDLQACLQQQPFDYLFSIVNEHVLSEHILSLPLQGAINYHDSLLPRYAGTNATMWAILAQEKTHGITWHFMARQVDAGPIIKQQEVDIAPDDSAFSLNMSCYEAAIQAFTALVDDLSTGNIVSWSQDNTKRTFFSRNQRPPAACLISWHTAVSAIDALIRATSYGPHPNPIGVPKFVLADQLFLIARAAPYSYTRSSYPAGCIANMTDKAIIIATSHGELSLEEATTLEGVPVPLPELTRRFHLHVGYQLPEMDVSAIQTIDRYVTSLTKYESYWVKQLITFPFVRGHGHEQRNGVRSAHSLASGRKKHLLREVNIVPGSYFTGWSAAEFLLTVFILYTELKRNNGQYALWFQHEDLLQLPEELQKICMQYVPLNTQIDDRLSVADAIATMREHIRFVKTQKTYLRDVFARYHLNLTSCSDDSEKNDNWLLGIKRNLATDWNGDFFHYAIACEVCADGHAYQWVYNEKYFSEYDVIQLDQEFSALLDDVIIYPKQPVRNVTLLHTNQLYFIY